TKLVVRLSTPISAVARPAGAKAARDVRWADRLERWVIRRADALAAPSDLLVNRLQASGWLGGRPVTVIPSPVDVAALAGPDPPGVAPPRVLAVGGVSFNKGADVLV